MKVSEMIEQLSQLQKEVGDVEVLVTDGYDGTFYRGEYSIEVFEDCIDIGIGGCKE